MKTTASIFLLPLLLLGACRAQESLGNNAASSTPAGASGEAAAGTNAVSGSTAPAQTATLTGLYESGTGEGRSQMCIVERSGRPRFGLVVRTSASDICSGNGIAVRNGATLRLAMEGDEACTFDARIEGTRVTFPAATPAGCAYYCSRGGRIAGTNLDKTGGAEADALRAEDLVGDRLCTG